MSNNYLYKIGDLVVIVGKRKQCGEILSWRVNQNDVVEYEVQHNGRIDWFPEYAISHCKELKH